MELTELGNGPLSHILKFLPLHSLVVASQVCKLLHHLAQDDTIWHAKALEKYPAETVRLGDWYTSYQELLRDDNREHAALLLPLAGRSCRYKMNRPHYFFECLALALEWDRSQQLFRLYIDARGEIDLRSPIESSVGFVVHRGQPLDRPALLQKLQGLEQRRQLALERLAAAQQCDASVATFLQLQHQLAREETQMAVLRSELAQPLELSFADLLTVVRPCRQHLLVDRPGHKLGYLEFDSLDKIDGLLRELPESYASKQQAQALGVDLAFCYANPIPVMPHGAMVDYEPVIVATVPPHSSLLAAFTGAGRYAVPGRFLDELAAEGPAERRRRWADHVPREVLNRQPPWLV